MTQSIIVIRGASGAGKTTVARLIREKSESRVAILCPDTFYHEVFAKADRQLVYGSLLVLINYYLSLGISIVLEGILSGYYENEFNQKLRNIAHDKKIPIFEFYLQADLENLLQRNKIRPHLKKEDQTDWYNGSIKSIANDIVINVNNLSPELVTARIFEQINAK